MALFGVGCGVTRATQEAPAATIASASVPQAGPLPQTITFQTDVAPIRALAFSGGWVWVGSDRGLRRVRVPGGQAAWLGPESGMVAGRPVSALATDGTGRVLVATDAEIGRLTEVAGRLHYQIVAKLAGVTHLGAGERDALWAGSPAGLFFIEGGRATPAEAFRGAAIASLDVDVQMDAGGNGAGAAGHRERVTAWVGVRGRGLLHVDRTQVIGAFGPGSTDHHLDFLDALGTVVLPNGTRMAPGRGAQGATRLMLLRLSGAELLRAEPEIPLLAVVSQSSGALARRESPFLLAGSSSTPRLYRLEPSDRGQPASTDAIRFIPSRSSVQSLRVAAQSDPRGAPAGITVAITGDGADGPGGDASDVFVGTKSLGVARLARTTPDYLPVGELALGARSLSVSCPQQERCVFATGVGPGWIWEGGDRPIKPMADHLPAAGAVMALAGDGRSTVYRVGTAGGKALNIARLSTDGGSWESVLTLPVRVEGTPVVTFAAVSPSGHLWMSLRDRAPSGEEGGLGAVELQLPAGRAIHHRPYKQGEPRPPEALPIAGEVSAVRFQKGSGQDDPVGIWFCTSLGVVRFAAGQISQWGENDGLDSESCADLEIAADGSVWAATRGGVARFDGRGWRRLGSRESGPPAAPMQRWPVDRDGDGLAARALVASGDRLWAATTRGLWPVTGTAAAPIDRGSGLVDDDVVDLATDRFGRVWVLGRLGVTVRRPLGN